MSVLTRLVVVGWMIGGLCLVAFAVGLPALLTYGLVTWWAGPKFAAPWLEAGLTWVMRLALCVGIWISARNASRVAGPGGPSQVTIAVCAAVGLACGLVIGIALRDTWGEAILATLGLPSESFMDDIVTGMALSGCGAVTFASTYLPRKAPLAQ